MPPRVCDDTYRQGGELLHDCVSGLACCGDEVVDGSPAAVEGACLKDSPSDVLSVLIVRQSREEGLLYAVKLSNLVLELGVNLQQGVGDELQEAENEGSNVPAVDFSVSLLMVTESLRATRGCRCWARQQDEMKRAVLPLPS